MQCMHTYACMALRPSLLEQSAKGTISVICIYYYDFKLRSCSYSGVVSLCEALFMVVLHKKEYIYKV